MAHLYASERQLKSCTSGLAAPVVRVGGDTPSQAALGAGDPKLAPCCAHRPGTVTAIVNNHASQ